MKLIPLIIAGLLRRPARSALMLAQLIVAFALFGVLQGVDTGINQAISRTHADRLFVASRVSRSETLPIGLLLDLQHIPGVRAVTYGMGFRGTYQRPNQPVVGIATNPASYFAMYSEFTSSPSQVTALGNTPDGAIVGLKLAQQYGWNIGDKIPLQSTLQQQDGTPNWSFEIVGIYDVPTQPEIATSVILNYENINRSRTVSKDTVTTFTVVVDDPHNTAAVAHAIDTRFANSSHETRTQSESDVARAQIERLGDIDFIAHLITGSAFVALLTALSALLMQSFRERSVELAILKAIGFSNRVVVAIIFTESLTLCLFGAALGMTLAILLLPMARKLIGGGEMPGVVVLMAAGCAVIVALTTGIGPSIRATRLNVQDELAGR